MTFKRKSQILIPLHASASWSCLLLLLSRGTGEAQKVQQKERGPVEGDCPPATSTSLAARPPAAGVSDFTRFERAASVGRPALNFLPRFSRAQFRSTHTERCCRLPPASTAAAAIINWVPKACPLCQQLDSAASLHLPLHTSPYRDPSTTTTPSLLPTQASLQKHHDAPIAVAAHCRHSLLLLFLPSG